MVSFATSQFHRFELGDVGYVLPGQLEWVDNVVNGVKEQRIFLDNAQYVSKRKINSTEQYKLLRFPHVWMLCAKNSILAQPVEVKAPYDLRYVRVLSPADVPLLDALQLSSAEWTLICSFYWSILSGIIESPCVHHIMDFLTARSTTTKLSSLVADKEGALWIHKERLKMQP